MDEVALLAIDSLFRDGATRTNETALMGKATSSTRSERAARRAQPSTSSSKPPRRALHKPAQTIAPKPTSRDARATKRKQQNISASNEDAYDHPDKECDRTKKHPVHVISTALPPKNITLWPELQNPDDVSSGMELLPPDKYKPGWPPDLIVLADKRGWSRILVPECQRMALIQTEHETMLHVKGNRVNHELSRSYYWPNMTEEVKSVCARGMHNLPKGGSAKAKSSRSIPTSRA